MKKIKNLKGKLIFTIFYLIIILLAFKLNISCIYKRFLNIPCPGCGMTRAFLSLIKLDLYAAFQYNSMIFLMPILYLYFLFDGSLLKNKRINMIIFIVIMLGLLINWLWKILKLFTN